MQLISSVIRDLKDALKESFRELTLFGKITLGPIVALLFLIIAISIVMVAYPLIMFKERYSKQIENGTLKIQQLFYRGT